MTKMTVWIAGVPAGALIQKPNGNLQFKYSGGYAGSAVSQALPVQPEAHDHETTRAVFGGLLPEGDARAALARNIGVSAGNDYALLEEVGGDVAGAMTFLPEGDVPPSLPETKPLSDRDLARLLDELPQRPLAADSAGGIRLSLAGAQAKVPVIIDDVGSLALPTNSAAPTTHILKPEPDRFPGLVDNEAFCMALARGCELSVARVAKARTTSGRPYLVVERYDRDLTGDPIRRLHQEDFCQALGIAADRKYQAEGGPTFAQAAGLVRSCTASPAVELPKLLRALAFNWAVGNCDAHGKNYSLLYDAGAPALAPLYDLVSTSIYPEVSTRLAMSIDGATHLADVSSGAWVKLAAGSELRPAFVMQTVRAMLDTVTEQAAVVGEAPEHQNDAVRQIVERIDALRLN